MKKRQILITTSATLTPTSTAPTTRPVSDERQITRVAQSVSPAVKKPENSSSSSISTIANSSASGSSTAAVALDLKPRSATDLQAGLQAAGMRPPLPVVTAASVMAASLSMAAMPPNGDQPPPGMNPLDYVKNKIMEEMKKHGEELNSQALLVTAGQKRASPEAGGGGGATNLTGNSSEDSATSKKLAKVDGGPSGANINVGNAGANTPDSPGSPGAMVIDERPEDHPKSEHKDAGPGNANDPGKANNPAVTSKSNSSAAPQGSASAASAAANTASTSSKYEPLSDDE